MARGLTESYWPAEASADLLEVTLGGLLRSAAAAVPDRLALVTGEDCPEDRRRWTYAELLTESERVARALVGRFEPGERVALYAPNCAEWMLVQHGLSLAGIELVPLNPAYREAEAEAILRSAKATGVFYAERFRDNDVGAIVAGLGSRIAHLRELVPLAELGSFSASAAGSAAPLPEVAPTDVLQVQFTSGTTGVPKGALLHHRGVINSSRFTAERAGFPQGGVWINAMPMFHVGGGAVSRIGCLSRQGTFVLADGFDPGGLLGLIESERGNTTLIVPTMILAMLGHESFPSRDLSSLVTVLSGAADVPATLVTRTTSEMGCRFSILFGQTEMNGVISQTHLDDSVADQSETVGTPLPHLEVKIADPDDATVLPIGQSGEICARGYQTMRSYLDMPAETQATIDADGWLHMGDLGTMDERGYLRITGRSKDMIIRGGMNLYPREIEEVLFRHPEIGQVSVVGVPDEKWGEIVAAVIVPRDPALPPSAELLTAYCRDRLARHKSPSQWFMVERFPLTPSGKVQKFVLQEWIAAGTIEATASDHEH
jgi:fatty-acyl-CoA synthase